MLGSLGSILLAAFGISFLIFIHEAGHFVAARMFGVRVEVFSIGFGPRLFGWRRGETDYRISAIPLGGYVKMAGEYGDESENAPPAPDGLLGKPAWQRAIVFSGGVLVNFAFAFLAFPLAFTLGVPLPAPVVGSVTPGGPAWQAGLQPGDVVLQVNGRDVHQFPDVALEVALGDPRVTTARIRRGEQLLDVLMHPVKNEAEGRYEIGVGLPEAPGIHVREGGPAWQAGLRTGDRIVRLDELEVRGGLAHDPAVAQRLQRGRDLDVVWVRDGVERRATIRPETTRNETSARLGVMPLGTLVAGLRGPAVAGPERLRVGDLLTRVGGTPVHSAEAVLERLAAAPPGSVPVTLERAGRPLTLELDAGLRAAALAGDVAFEAHFAGTAVQVLPDSALGEAGFVDGDVLVAVDGQLLGSYADLQRLVQGEPRTFAIRWRTADGVEREAAVRSRPITVADYGFGTSMLEEVRRESLTSAVTSGVAISLNMLRHTWLTLTRLVSGDVSPDNLGGIVQISVLTYRVAEASFAQLLFFLGLLSINLGFINILPIPVLDGGQVMFLIFEKIKGGRLSERFLNSMQMAGLVLILALVVYITYQDILKLAG